MKKTYVFQVNGFMVTAQYRQETVSSSFIPLLRQISALYQEKGRRLIVYLAAPPGTGKTTLASFFAYLSGEIPNMVPLQSVGLDGFHYPKEYLSTNFVTIAGRRILMSDVKGSPETFDIKSAEQKIKALQEPEVKWPIYDRNRHDVIADQILITGEIVLIEGNWLLLDEPGFRQLRDLCDYSIFIKAKEKVLKRRLIERKERGGLSAEAAEAFYQNSDRKNIIRAMEHRLSADTVLQLQENGDYLLEEEGYESK